MKLEEIDEELENLSSNYKGDSLKQEVENLLGDNQINYQKILESTISGTDHISHEYRIEYEESEYILRVQDPDGRPGDRSRISLNEK